MAIQYADAGHLLAALQQTPAAALDFVVLVTGALAGGDLAQVQPYLDECGRVLRAGGLLFVQGRPETLPAVGVYLDRTLRFRYWIALESAPRDRGHGLPSVHAGLLLFCQGERFQIERVRFPHESCAFCGRTRRDWGGKAHLMHPEGYAISDVWKALPPADNYGGLSDPVLETILALVGAGPRENAERPVAGLVGPREGLGSAGGPAFLSPPAPSAPAGRPLDPFPAAALASPGDSRGPDCMGSGPPPAASGLWNVVRQGDALEILRRYPDASVDLAFADPPYNLDKAYSAYEDEQERQAYLDWCNDWLAEYIRILKPTGALYVLNLPHWAMYHAAFLNRHLSFQNWIVWDALSEPRGKLMPAHYALLFYTKHRTAFTWNYDEVGRITSRAYCLRASCLRQREQAGATAGEPLTDLWWDIHRLKHRRDRDYHPCQLPDALLERLIGLSTNPGDVVLDALAGTGTTAVVAARLGRRYVAIDIDPAYVEIARRKIAQVQHLGQVQRPSLRRARPPYSQKSLQLELRRLAQQLGRLPTPEDVQALSAYGLEAYEETFPSWGKALKAAKLEVGICF